MKKDAYYFPHFCNARHDRKLKRLQKDLGMEGYGIFFMLLEVLREQTDFRFPYQDVDLLADEFGTSTAKIEVVIRKYDLFMVDDENKFFSPKLVFYLQPYLEKSERARIAANKRWFNANSLPEQSKSNAFALPEHCNGNASKVKESKVKESKEEVGNPPSENKFPDDSSEIILSKELFDYIKANNEKAKEPNIQNWAQHIGYLLRIDNRTPDEIRAVMKWSQQDSFWRSNILSTQKLREKFNTLYLQSQNKPKEANRIGKAESDNAKVFKLDQRLFAGGYTE